MRAINHALTGALLGLTISEPLIALPAALVSHFVLDAIPHHGTADGGEWLSAKSFRYSLYIDASLCFLLVMLLAIRRPQYWITAAFCAFLGAAPDLLSFNRYLATLRHKPFKPGLYSRLAHNIQWFERPIGAVVEVAWCVAAVILLVPLVR
jgi:hypothetical protein